MSDARTVDLYEVTMAMSYLGERMTRPATFSLFVRALPPERGFLFAAGLESALEFLSGFRVGREDVAAFASACTGLRPTWNRCSASSSPGGCGRCPRAGSCWRANPCWR